MMGPKGRSKMAPRAQEALAAAPGMARRGAAPARSMPMMKKGGMVKGKTSRKK
jgi:hypothetical protein